MPSRRDVADAGLRPARPDGGFWRNPIHFTPVASLGTLPPRGREGVSCRPEKRARCNAAEPERLPAYNGIFVIRPVESTNQRSLANVSPRKRAAVQSASSGGRKGPRLVEATPAVAWRASWYTTKRFGPCTALSRRSVLCGGLNSSNSPATHRYGMRIFSARPSHVSVWRNSSNFDSYV